MWKIITIIIVILVIFFGYIIFKDSGNIFTSTDDGTTIIDSFSSKFISDMASFTGGSTATLPEDPIVSEKDLGELSPLYGKVVFTDKQWGLGVTDKEDEYITINALASNTNNINISGWSLQSMITGVRVYIQDAVDDVQMHTVNPTYEIELEPEQKAIINTIASPIGVSFKTNICTGYLGQFQEFEPGLEKNCPTPSEQMQPTISNIQLLGGECIEFATMLEPCTYLTTEIIDDSDVNASKACIEYLRTELTYTSCSARNSKATNYKDNAHWRIFLNQPATLWSMDYEVIRLLDEAGRTVSVYTY